MRQRYLLLGAMLISGGVAVPACSDNSAQNWELEVHSRPWLATPLVEYTPTKTSAASVEELRYHDLDLRTPANLAVSQSTVTVSDGTDFGTMQKEIVRVEERSGKRRIFALVYVPGIITSNVGLGQTPEVKQWCRDFESFRKQFSSDYELIRAAYAVLPRDVDGAKSELEREKLRTLLMVKDSLDLPAEEIRLPNIRAFAHIIKHSGIVYVSTFDEFGKFRSRFAFYQLDIGAETRPAASQSGDEEDILVSVLRVSHFAT